MTEILLTIFCSVMASTGLWTAVNTYLQKRNGKKSAETRMLIGLGHDRICYLGEQYIKRGYITFDEYENLHEYLYAPYEDLGGNGSAKKIMEEVKKLPMREGRGNEE